MRASLRCEVPIRHLFIHAEIGWVESRPELGDLCREAQRGDGLVNNVLVLGLFPGLAEAGAANVLRWVRSLGLCNDSGELTRMGLRAAESDRVAVPEEGVFSVWYLEHPLTGPWLLHIRRERMDWSRWGQEELCELPSGFPRDKGAWRSVIEKDTEFHVYDVVAPEGEVPVCAMGSEEKRAELIWDLDFVAGTNRWHLAGAEREFETPGESRDGLDLSALFGRWVAETRDALGSWDRGKRRLLVRPGQLSEPERATFRAARDFPCVQVPSAGEYRDVHVLDIPLAPPSDPEATAWARQLLDHRAAHGECLTWPEIRQEFGRIVHGSPLDEYEVVLPSADDLLTEQHRAGNRAAYWRLASVLDLAPLPVPDWQCGELRLTKGQARGVARNAPDRIAIRMGERAAVAAVLAQFLAGAQPSRVVLCDRYVRGDSNLRALAVFCRALQESSPGCRLEVVTLARDTARRTVEQGIAPVFRTYEEVFGPGGKALHDRYLLVHAGSGHPFIWWMSNSLLDVSLPEQADPHTPGVWRELLANRCTLQEVSPALSRLAGERA